MIWWGVVAAMAALLAAAFLLDNPIAHAVAPYSRTVKHSSTLAKVAKELGGVMFGVVVVLCAIHPKRWMAGALVLASAGIGGLFEVVLKWGVGRSRPMQANKISVMPFSFDPFRGGVPGFFDQANLCFPSGHSTLAFAVATSLSILLPRWTLLWLALATLVGIERVAELAHYPSDVVGGAIAGSSAAFLARYLIGRFVPQVWRGSEPRPAADDVLPNKTAGDVADPR